MVTRVQNPKLSNGAMFYKVIGSRVKAFKQKGSVNDATYQSLVREVAKDVLATRVRDNWKGGRELSVLPTTLKEYLDTVSFKPSEIKKLYNRLCYLEHLVLSGDARRAQKYGNYLAGSYLLTKSAAHNVLRDRTSPGLGADIYRYPWFLDLNRIRKLRGVELPRMRVWLDKPDGSLRPLAIPTLEDRIRERALVTVAELLAAKMQSSNSIGFRYNQDRHRGLEEFLSKAVRKYGAMGFSVVDTDFRKYYDTIPHSGLRTIMRKVGLKGSAWRYFCSTLIAPVQSSSKMVAKARGKITGPMAEEMYIPTRGTPQGGVISPLLANLYGAKLDKGLEDLGLVHIRYADNVLVAYPSEKPKEWIMDVLEGVKPTGITLHPDKTQYLIGNGILVTLGCGIIRENGQVRLMVCEGYDRRVCRPGPENLVRRPFGGIPYLGGILDILRNLKVSSLHQRSPDRKGWSRKVLNLRTYLAKSNPWGLKGGVWRDVKVLPEFKGVARLKGLPWYQVKVWSDGKVKLMDLLALSSKQRGRVKELQLRMEAQLHNKIAALAGLGALHEGFSFSEDGYLFYRNLSKVKAKYYRKSARYAFELASHIISRNHGGMLRRGEMEILGKGYGRGAGIPKSTKMRG